MEPDKTRPLPSPEPSSEPSELAGTLEQSEDETVLFDDRYRVQRTLGEGGFGRVLLVEDMLHQGQLRALKTILPQRQQHDQFERRFRNEIQVMRSLQHPGIPQIFNDGRTPEGEFYFTMAFVNGRPFSKVMKQDGALPPERVARVLRDVVQVLCYAHGRGVIHRDLKPDNILLQNEGRADESVRVLDFGIAKILEKEGELESAHSMQTQAPIGTPHYMSPEQVAGRDVDGSTDIYALGILIYQLLSGKYPFKGTTYMELMAARLHDEPEPLSPRLEPAWARSLVPRLMARDPRQRPTAPELVEELDRIVAGQAPAPSIRSGRGRRGLAVLALVGVAAAGALAWTQRGDPGAPADPDATVAGVEPPARAQDAREATPSEQAAIEPETESGIDVDRTAPAAAPERADAPSESRNVDEQHVPAIDDAVAPSERTPAPPEHDTSADATAPASGASAVEDEPEQDDHTQGPSADEPDPESDPSPPETEAPSVAPAPPRIDPPSGTTVVGTERTADGHARVVEHSATGLRFVLVTAGRSQRDGAVHGAKEPFYLSRTEVTRAAFARYAAATRQPMPRAPRKSAGGEELPMTLISQGEAEHFAHWAGGALPSPGQLDWAAAGPGALAYPWGDAEDAVRCNLDGEADGFDGLAPADSFDSGASWCAALHLCGNAAEWTSDPEQLFGGSYDSRSAAPRSKKMVFVPERRADIGFRIALPIR